MENAILFFKVWSFLALLGALLLCLSENRKLFIKDFLQMFEERLLIIVAGLILYWIYLPCAIIYFIKELTRKIISKINGD